MTALNTTDRQDRQNKAYLAHEIGDDPVEGGALVSESLLSGAQGAEVLGGLGDHVSSQLKTKTQL